MVLSLGLALAFAGAVGAQPTLRQSGAQAATAQQSRVASRSQIAFFGQGSWCWFGDPRAVRVVGQYDETFAGWIDWNGNVTIGAYDPSFGVMRTHIIGTIYHDDHSSPAIFVEPDKRLTAFWSGHNGSQMYYRTTLRPEDITAWGPVQTVHSRIPGDLGFTYPNPVLLPSEGNKLYLFWRGANWSADYATRTITGHWSPARQLISVPGQRPYLKVDTNGSDTIALAFTNGHPRERITSIFYAAYRAGSLWHANGRRITRLGHGPIAPRRADLVYNGQAKHTSSWVWDVALDQSQHPVIVYATFPSAFNHVYWYARWTGKRWVSHFMTFAGPTISPGTIETEYSGGITLDHSNPSIVYLSRKVNGWFEIEKWVTKNGGYSWSHETVVRTPGQDDLRPLVARGSNGGPASLFWLQGHYGTYTSYRTSIAFLK